MQMLISVFELNAIPVLHFSMLLVCSKAVNNAVDLFKYFGSKGSVIRYVLSLLEPLMR